MITYKYPLWFRLEIYLFITIAIAILPAFIIFCFYFAWRDSEISLLAVGMAGALTLFSLLELMRRFVIEVKVSRDCLILQRIFFPQCYLNWSEVFMPPASEKRLLWFE